jgi:DNA-binding CsgD family transcriptional regulator
MTPSALRSLALGVLRREQGRVAEADEHLRFAMQAALPESPSLHHRAALALTVLQNRIYQGATGVETLTGVQVDDDPELACDIETNRAIALWQSGRPDAAEAVLAQRTISPRGTAWDAELLAVRGMVRHYTGSLSSSLDDLDASIALSSLWRPSTNQVRVYVVRSRARFQSGDWDGSVADAATGHAIASGQTELWNLPLVSATAMLVPTWRGQWETAQRHVEEGKAAVSPSLWAGPLGAMLRLSELQLFEARGDRDRLLSALAPMMTEKELESLSPFRAYLRIFPPWITACLDLGRLGDARQALERYEQLLLRWPHGPEAAAIGLLRGLVALADGDAVRARQHFADDLADPDVRARPFQLARLHQAAGRLEVLVGEHQAAVGHLRQALAGFTQLSATPSQESCRRDLNGIGATGDRTPSETEWGLTERESTVAAFVRRGCTNKEIARELFVTVKAVEYHLTRIYAKVDVHGRHELRQLLTSKPDPGAAPTTTR